MNYPSRFLAAKCACLSLVLGISRSTSSGEEVCPEAGDTHCAGLQADVTFDFSKGTLHLRASAADDSGDSILYTFRAAREDEEHVAGPQLEDEAALEVGFGPWTVTVIVDDDLSCDDAAADFMCSTEVYVHHIDFLMHARGDVDGNGSEEITDAIRILLFLFEGSSRTNCLAAADVNSDGVVDLSDAIALLVFLFLDGNKPAWPFPFCGFSGFESDYLLGCDTTGGCS